MATGLDLADIQGNIIRGYAGFGFSPDNAAFWIYDPTANRWRPGPDCPSIHGTY